MNFLHSFPLITRFFPETTSGTDIPIKGEVTYQGTSMFPTLMEGDRIIMHRTGPFRRGDIVVYREPGGDRIIIHRIIKTYGSEVLTAGDNNANPDPYLLQTRDIIGTVILIQRVKTLHRVMGDLPGYLRYLYETRYNKQVCRIIIRFRPVYLGISVSSPLKRLISGRYSFHPQILIKPDGSVLIRVFLKSRYVAWLHVPEGVWHIRPPYRLVISESDLPDPREVVTLALGVRMGEFNHEAGYSRSDISEAPR